MQKNVLNYRIIIEKEKYKDGSTVYVAYCPSLGISDYGDTVEDVLVSIKDGIELTVESLAKEGQFSSFPFRWQMDTSCGTPKTDSSGYA